MNPTYHNGHIQFPIVPEGFVVAKVDSFAWQLEEYETGPAFIVHMKEKSKGPRGEVMRVNVRRQVFKKVERILTRKANLDVRATV